MAPGKSFHVFVSYSRKNDEFVRRLVKRLKNRNIRVWFDEEITPGASWQKQLAMLVEEIPSVIVVVGDEMGKFHEAEIEVVIEQSVNRGIPLIPVLAKSNGYLSPFLKRYNWVDCSNGITSANLDKIIYGITGKKSKEKKKIKVISDNSLALAIKSNIQKRGSRIPYRVVKDGTTKYAHYPLRISLSGPSDLLDHVTEVEYKLHKAFKRPRRVTSDRVSNFAIEVWIYGGFEMYAIVRFDNKKVAKLKYEVELLLPDDNGTNYVLDKSKIGESIFEGCDLPE